MQASGLRASLRDRGAHLTAPKYQPEYADQARKLCRFMGATDAMMAEFFGVCRNTILNWRDNVPEFAAACREGKLRADLEVVESLHRRATGYDHDGRHYPADPASGIWWTKNRLNWRDKPAEDPEDVAMQVVALRDALREMDKADGE